MFHWSSETVRHPWWFNTVEKGIWLQRINLQNFEWLNRFQYIETDNKKTGKLQINTDVPQGSTLGLFLFLVFSNDLPRYIENSAKIAIFADDTSIVKGGPRNQCNFQTDLDRLYNWFSDNQLSLNIPKCEVMNFGVGTTKDLTLTNEKLPMQNACQYLGVYLDKKLISHDNNEYVVKKLNKFSVLI